MNGSPPNRYNISAIVNYSSSKCRAPLVRAAGLALTPPQRRGESLLIMRLRTYRFETYVIEYRNFPDARCGALL